MENWFTEHIGFYAGPVKPRTVQKLFRQGVGCCVFTGTRLAPGEYIFEDIDGTKVIGLVPAKGETPDEAQVIERITPHTDTLPDLPVYNITGAPDDAALAYPENGVLQGRETLYVNAANVGLGSFTEENGVCRLELTETAGKETAYELFCPALDFGFRTLLRPWETKTFTVAPDGSVTESY